MATKAEVNKLERFKRLSTVYDEWPQCCICRLQVDKGFTVSFYDEGPLVVVTVCDDCLAEAKRRGSGGFVFEA